MGGNQQNWELDRPEDDMANHLLGSYTYTLGYGVGNIEVRGPNCANHLGHGRRTSVGLDRMPEECSNGSNDHSEPRKVESHRRSHCDREGNMQACADHTIEDQWHCAHKTAENDADHCLTPNYFVSTSNV